MNRQLRIFSAMALTVAIGNFSADAADHGGDQGIYGRLDLVKFPKPELINDQPVLIDKSSKRASTKTVFVHVPPGYERHWQFHCKTYDSCNVPVQFVTESWFVNVYLPAIGAQDGREQRYRMQARPDRDAQRDLHERRGEN